jgi:hypothetical protein
MISYFYREGYKEEQCCKETKDRSQLNQGGKGFPPVTSPVTGENPSPIQGVETL